MSLRDRLIWDDLVGEQNPVFVYDPAAIANWKASMPPSALGQDAIFFDPPWLKTPYRSSWRMLHIDGFEPGLAPLPASTRHAIQFFTPTEV